MKMRRLLVWLVVFVGLGAPVRAQEQVDVELVFLADASGSIDEAEIIFQRRGYAEAIQHPAVLKAIARGLSGKIAVTFVEWGDETSQDTVVPWTRIDGAASARTFAETLVAAPRRAFGRNAIGAAIAAAQARIESNRFEGLRKVIDLSADSANNWGGMSIAEARSEALAAGMIINGLAVLCRDEACGGRPVAYDLEQAFAATIIGGPGSFVVTVDSKASFAEAVRRKLILELADNAATVGGRLR